MTNIVILTDADLSKDNGLAKNLDELIPRLSNSSMGEVAKFFGFKEDTPFSDIYLIGERFVLRLTPEKQYLFRSQPTQAMPSLTEQLANISKAAGRVIKAAVQGEPVQASTEQREARLAICKGCEQFNNNRCTTVTLADGTVKKGCGCSLPAKAALATESCPQGKW